MFRISLRGLTTRPIRLMLTAAAVVVGVALVVGTYVFSDTIRATLQADAAASTSGIDAFIQGRPTGSASQGRLSLPANLVGRVARLPGVTLVQEDVQGQVQMLAPDGSVINGGLGSPLGISVGSKLARNGVTLERGRFPKAANEMVADAATVAEEHWKLGHTVLVASDAVPVMPFRLVGIVQTASARNLGASTLAGFALPTAQHLVGLNGRYSALYVQAARGVGEASFVRSLGTAIGSAFDVSTPSQFAAQQVNETTGNGLGFLSTVVLVLGGVTLFVGAFIVFNTFEITVAQRRRELGLLRCLGASKKQIVGSVVIEALIVGLIAAAVGLLVGSLVAKALMALLAALGVALPTTTPQIDIRTLVVALVGGVAVTLVASANPAFRAGRVSPLAALQDEDGSDVGESLRRRVAFGGPAAAVGATLVAWGLLVQSNNQAVTVGAGAGLLFLGITALSPILARPLISLISGPHVPIGSYPRFLARQNALRNPRRTGSTASALMVGVTLVSFMAIIASSVKASVSSNIAQDLKADYIVQANSSGTQPFSNDIVSRLRAQPELSVVSPLVNVPVRQAGGAHMAGAIDPATYPEVVGLGTVVGNLADLDRGGVAVALDKATANHWRVGDSVTLDITRTGPQRLTIRAIYSSLTFDGYLLPIRAAQRDLGDSSPTRVFVTAKAGVTPRQSRAAVGRALTGFPQIRVDDQAQVKANEVATANRTIYLITGVLVLAIVVAFLGIVNTLVLSVVERTRELGLLRAVGMTRRQVRATILWESMMIATFGALLGLGIGVLLGWAMQQSLKAQEVTHFAVPFGQLVAYLVVAGIAGTLAGVLPARGAARLDVIEAIAAE